jgi:hypothetical protein
MIGTKINKVFDVKLENSDKASDIISKYDEKLEVKTSENTEVRLDADNNSETREVSFTLMQSEDAEFKGVLITYNDKRRLFMSKESLKYLDELYTSYKGPEEEA